MRPSCALRVSWALYDACNLVGISFDVASKFTVQPKMNIVGDGTENSSPEASKVSVVLLIGCSGLE